MLLTAEKFANIYLSVSIVIFAVGMLLIEQRPEEETISFDTPIVITPGVQNLVFPPLEINAGE